MQCKDKKCAFTLAETLITLVIVGVVAALTVPIVYNKFQNDTLVSNLKVFYSDFSNMMIKYTSDNSYNNLNNSPLADTYNSSQELSDYFIDNIITKYMSGKKINKTVKYKFLKGSSVAQINWQFMSSKGYFIKIAQGSWGSNVTIYVDTNGFKGPNRIGLDVFRLYLFDQAIFLPAYKKLRDWDCAACADSCTPDLASSIAGYGCWARIIQEGWKITYN